MGLLSSIMKSPEPSFTPKKMPKIVFYWSRPLEVYRKDVYNSYLRPHRLARSRTPGFQSGNTGSNPVGDVIFSKVYPWREGREALGGCFSDMNMRQGSRISFRIFASLKKFLNQVKEILFRPQISLTSLLQRHTPIPGKIAVYFLRGWQVLPENCRGLQMPSPWWAFTRCRGFKCLRPGGLSTRAKTSDSEQAHTRNAV